MRLSNLEKILIQEGLEGYFELYIDEISNAERSISVVKENDNYVVYMSWERGHIDKMGEYNSEEEVCQRVISMYIYQKKNEEQYTLK